MEQHDEFADLDAVIESLQAVTEYVEVASLLSKDCNIPPSHFLALCKTLEDAYDVYAGGHSVKARSGSMRSSLKAVRALQRAMEAALEAFGLLDLDTRLTISRAVERNHEDAFFDTGMGTLSPGFEIEIRQQRLRLEELFAATRDAAGRRIDQTRGPRGRPPDTALADFVGVLRQFWVEKLGRSFYDAFEENFESSDDPNKGTYTPVNEASRFVVGAVQRLIEEDVDVATCRWMMRRVSAGT